MAATDTMSLLVAEILAQCDAALSSDMNDDQVFSAEWPSGDINHWPHDCCIVRWGAEATRAETNETDGHTIPIMVALLTRAPKEQREGAGQTVAGWARTVRRTLGERASRASPLRTDPLPLSGGDMAGADAAFSGISFGVLQTNGGEVEGVYRAGAVLPVIIRTQELASA